MSSVIIQSLLESRVDSHKGSDVDLARPNVNYTPGTRPWIKLDVLYSKASNPTMGDGFKREVGILQLLLHYPPNNGAGSALAKAESLKTAFKRGTSMASGIVNVWVDSHPWSTEVPGDESWYKVVVNVPFLGDVYS